MNKLNGKKINALLRETFEQHTPDCADQIIRAASGKNAAPTVSVVQEPSRISYIRRGAAIAVAAALIFSLIAAAIVIRNNEPYATVTVESDVCVAISLNRAYKPIEIRAESASAEPIVQNIAESHTLEDSVDSILDRMLENGNLSEESNTVLITANAPENADALLNAAYAAAKKSFEESRYRGAILTAVASHDEDILDLARRYHISVGKVVLVAEIHSKEQRYDAELLSRLSVNDLNLLTTYRRIRYERIGIYGVSRSGMTPDDAIALAKENAGMDDATASVTVDLGDSGLIYCVSLRSGNHVYQCCMNAGSGDVIGVTDEIIAVTATEPAAPTAPPVPAAPTEPKPVPTAPPRTEPAPSPSTGHIAPTAPAPTQPAPPAPTQPVPTQPSAFTGSDYLRTDIPPENNAPGADARRVAITRIINGYDVFYDQTNFPYAAAGQQGGISALVCSREQFVTLTGRGDDRFGDDYFAEHVLYIHINRDVSYHWIKSVQGAYMDGGTLFLESGEPVGYYITTGDENPERIYTVVWELNKAELYDLVNVREFEG